jgi:hypothetical protein
MSDISHGKIDQGLAEKRKLFIGESNGQWKNVIAFVLGFGLAKDGKRERSKSNIRW